MTTIYNDEDLLITQKQKKNILTAFFVILGVYIALCAVCVVFFVLLPYEDPYQKLVIAILMILTSIFILFVVPFMGIKFKRVKYYLRQLNDISAGLKETNMNEYVTRLEKTEPRYYVDYVVLIFREWNEEKQEYFERRVLFDNEKEIPDFREGDKVRYLTQGNVMVEYEVVERATEIESDEDEEPQEVSD